MGWRGGEVCAIYIELIRMERKKCGGGRRTGQVTIEGIGNE